MAEVEWKTRSSEMNQSCRVGYMASKFLTVTRVVVEGEECGRC